MTTEMPAGGFTAGARRRRPWRAAVWGLVVVLVLLLGAGSAVATELSRYRDHLDGRALPGATANGVDLAGMTVEEARTAIDAALTPELDRPIELFIDGETYTTTPRRLGATTDAAAVAEQAVAAGTGLHWTDLAELRWRDAEVPFTGEARISYPPQEARALVRRLADEVRAEPVDAELTWTRDRPVVAPERPGRELDEAAAFTALMAAVRGEGSDRVDLPVRKLAPEVTTDRFRRILFLRHDQRRLYLWRDGEVIRDYPVAIGTPAYPTPRGRYEITLKRRRPTWVNPSPNGWGRTMPARIGPGPDNPLGMRALNWSAPGAIRFHGTTDLASLGTPASHGCVRMANRDVIDLFELVEVGDVILSVG